MQASFPNAILLDAGASPVALHVVSAYLDPKEQAAKALALKSGDDAAVDMGARVNRCRNCQLEPRPNSGRSESAQKWRWRAVFR